MATAAEPGMKLSDAGKQYSQASSSALKRLNSIDRKFEGITERIESVAAIPEDDDSGDNVLKLLKAKNELAQIVGDLERLQCRELDAVETAELNSGKTEARTKRKSLNASVENLMRRTQNLHNEFVVIVDKIKAGKFEDDLGSTTPISQDSALPPTGTEPAIASKRNNRRRRGYRGHRGRRGNSDQTWEGQEQRKNSSNSNSESLVRAVQSHVAASSVTV